MNRMTLSVDTNNRAQMIDVIKSSLGTKFISRWSELMCGLAYQAVKTVLIDAGGRKEIDIKRYVRVEKVPGGEIEDSCVLDGVMINKDVTHSKMRRRIENPRIILVDCPLEYKKGESQINVEVRWLFHLLLLFSLIPSHPRSDSDRQIKKEEDFNRLLELEEEYIREMCDQIIALKPDLVITEKGLSDLAQHYFVKAGITALRRLKKTDNLRVAR